MTTTSWLAIAEHARDAPAYLALLRGQELPTRIVSALDDIAKQRRERALPSHDEDEEISAITSVLLRMIENKLSFQGSLPSDQQRIVDYAHEWATETLLSLHVNAEEESEWTPSPALEAMQSSLFMYASHTPQEELRHHQTTVLEALKDGSSLSHSKMSRILDVCALNIADDDEFVEFVEAVVGDPTTGANLLALGDAAKARLYPPHDASEPRLFDLLSLQARVSVWACEPSIWTQQLDHWMLRAFEEPFTPIDTVIQLPTTTRWPSHLYTELILWATSPSRRPWLQTCRGRSVIRHLSITLQDDAVDSISAFGRKLLAGVPGAVLSRWSSPWSEKQRAYILQSISAALPTIDSTSWFDYVGIVERYEVIQYALDVLLTKPVEDTQWAQAMALFTWFEARTFGVTSAKQMGVVQVVVQETVAALGVDHSWQEGVQWLQQHRSSSFATLTLTRLRIAWWWLLSMLCSTGSSAVSSTSVAEVLECIEYAYRRFAPATEPWKFHVEVIALFLTDLEWRSSKANGSTSSCFNTPATRDTVVQWLTKLVRLLAMNLPDAQRLNYPRQLDDWLKTLAL